MALGDNSIYELYLYTIDVYTRLVGVLPLDEKLARFDSQSFSGIGDLELGDEAFAAVSMRLMLQRKYFVRGKDLFLKKLLKSAKRDFEAAKDDIASLLIDLDRLNAQPIEFAFGDNVVVEGAHANVEDAMYGALLHADRERIENLVCVPESMRILALAPYIAGREQILLRFSELLLEVGIKPLVKGTETSAVVSFETKGADRLISNSPYWKNLRGNELGLKDIEDIARQASCDDSEIFSAVQRFVMALKSNPLDLDELGSIVATETISRWGDFSQAAKAVDGDYGMSTLVRHQKDGTALVKLLPNVQEPFLVEGPQIIEGGHEIVLVKHGGSWKIWAMR